MSRSLPAVAQPGSWRPSRDLSSGPRLSDIGDPTTGTRSRPRVLIVDDDKDTRDLYAWCMRAAGWLVYEVADGGEALMIAPAILPHVIVMDLVLPVIGGLEAIVRLRMDVRTTDIPVVACTGMGAALAEVQAWKAGCAGFIAKPCRPDDLRALLEGLVAERGG